MGSDSASKAAQGEEGRFQVRHGVNLHKGTVMPAMLALMYYYDCWTPTSLIYLAMHGVYGATWLLKDAVFPDKSWDARGSFGVAFMPFLLLTATYMCIPWIIASSRVENPLWTDAVAVYVFCVGQFLMHGSDCQKYFQLKYHPGLITDGFFKYLRNPNYLGELLTYGAFVYMTRSLWAAGATLFMVATLWVPNMQKKDKSLSRHKGFADYKKASWLFIPFVW